MVKEPFRKEETTMKFEIVKAKFVESLKSVQNIVGSKTTSPIMQNAKIEAKGGKLEITTTDLDVSIDCVADCEVIEEGATTLPVKILSAAVACSPDGVVRVDVDENEKASIVAGSAKFKLSGMPEKLFPRMPVSDEATEYTIQQAVLKEMLRKTSYAVSQDETRRVLNGVYMRFQEQKLTMVATDGRRLALVEKEVEYPQGADSDVVLPTKAVQELQRALSSEGDVKIKLQNTQIRFSLGSVTIFSKIVDEPYPNYKQVIPPECSQAISVDRQQLITALERVGVMSNDLHSAKLTFFENVLLISSSANDIGEAKDEVPVKYCGEQIDIIFNPSYILDALKAIDDDEITFNLNDGHSPAVIRCSIPFLYVIMPLRVG